MFCQSQAFSTETIQILSGFFDFQKKPSTLKKPEFKIWLQKSNIGNPASR